MFKRYKRNQDGSMAVFSAIGSACLLMAIGAAMEMYQLTSSVDNLQDVADSAVLAAAVSGETDNKELQDIALASIQSNSSEKISLKLKTQGEEIIVDVFSEYDPVFMGMFGHKTRSITAKAGSVAGTGGKLNIALALDTTTSMAGGRISAMIDAATDLVEKVEEADKGQGNAMIALVPFSNYVRLDTSFAGEDWIDVQPDHESSWQVLDAENSENCQQVGSGENAYTECDNYAYTTQTEMLTWEGCMVSRPDGRHKSVAFDGRPFKGATGHTSCDDSYSAMVPLTKNFEQLKLDIERLDTKGQTYLPSGLIWAWRALDEQGLFDPKYTEEDTNVQRVLLLMTDGSNTTSLNGVSQVDDWDGLYHWGQSDEDKNREKADELTVQMCGSIKDAGIRLVTVAYEVDDDKTRSMLETCASTGADFYDANNAAKLKDAFGKIGSGFNSVRLTL